MIGAKSSSPRIVKLPARRCFFDGRCTHGLGAEWHRCGRVTRSAVAAMDARERRRVTKALRTVALDPESLLSLQPRVLSHASHIRDGGRDGE